MPHSALFRGGEAGAIRGRAPLRLGLAGGGTDVEPFATSHGGLVLNVTIDKYCHATVRALGRGSPIVHALDLGIAETHIASRIENTELLLHHAVLRRLSLDFNSDLNGLQLITWADAPKGSGLGTSSTLVVAMLEALRAYFHLPLTDYALAELAWSIEREDAGQIGGRQDQYAAAFGGFNYMRFDGTQTVVTPLRLQDATVRELEASLVLFYTGQSRVSGDVIQDQAAAFRREDERVIEAALRLKEDAAAMHDALVLGDLKKFGDILARSWDAKRATSPLIETDRIRQAIEAAYTAGADAAKVSGAGGGGFIMFFGNPECRHAIVTALQSLPYGQVEMCKFTREGAVTWAVN